MILFRKGFARRDTEDKFRRGVATGALAGCFAVLVHSAFDFTLHTTSNALLFLILAAMATLGQRVNEGGGHHRRRRRRASVSEPDGLLAPAPEGNPLIGTHASSVLPKLDAEVLPSRGRYDVNFNPGSSVLSRTSI